MGAPIVIAGMGRSGTSIVGELFQRHPDTAYRYETLSELMPGLVTSQANGLLRPHRVYEVLGRVIPAPPGRRLVFKDPLMVRHFPVARQLWPGCYYVHVQRDPRDVACSIESAIARGKGTVEHMQLRLDAVPGIELATTRLGRLLMFAMWQDAQCSATGHGVVQVQYEELLADPGTETRRLMLETGLPWCREVGEHAALVADDATGYVAKGSRKLFVADHAQRVGRWRYAFTSEERDLARRLGLEE